VIVVRITRDCDVTQGGEESEEEKTYREVLKTHILNHGVEEVFLHSGKLTTY